MKNKLALSGRVILALCAVTYGTESIVAQLAFDGGFNAVSLIVVRYVVSALVLLGLALYKKAPLLAPAGLRGKTAVIGLLQGSNTICFYLAIFYLPPALAVMFFYAYPSLTALVANLCWHKRLSSVQVGALILSALGLVLLYYSAEFSLDMRGVAFALLSALLHAFRLNLTQRVADKMNSYTFNFDVMIVVLLWSCLVAATGFQGGFTLEGVRPIAMLPMLYVALAITVVGNLLVNKQLPLVGAVDTALLMLIEPVTAAILAFIVFGDVFTGWQWLGALLIIAAVALPIIKQKLAPHRPVHQEV